MFNHIKESPILSMLGLGGGIGSKLSGSAGGAIEATGGTTYEVGDFKFHLINTSTPSPTANFSIDVLHPDSTNNVIDFLVVGGGGGAGGGEIMLMVVVAVEEVSSETCKILQHGGPYPISVGAGGAGQPIDNSNPGNNGAWWRYNNRIITNPIYFIAKGGGGGAIVLRSFGTNGSPGGSGGGGAGGGPGPNQVVVQLNQLNQEILEPTLTVDLVVSLVEAAVVDLEMGKWTRFKWIGADGYQGQQLLCHHQFPHLWQVLSVQSQRQVQNSDTLLLVVLVLMLQAGAGGGGTVANLILWAVCQNFLVLLMVDGRGSGGASTSTNPRSYAVTVEMV